MEHYCLVIRGSTVRVGYCRVVVRGGAVKMEYCSLWRWLDDGTFALWFVRSDAVVFVTRNTLRPLCSGILR